jgi:aryl sulfotransferase
MTNDLPKRTVTYSSDTSTSGIWALFKPRDGDIYICTPPKSGTTWMQSICGMLVFGDAAVNPGIGTTSRWIDSAFNDEAEVLACLDAQTHRRYIKTHTPLDGITYDPGGTYLTVYRHPLDVIFSAQSHLRNMKNGALDHLIAEDMNAAVRDWIDAPFSPNDNIGGSLESLVHHYLSYRQFAPLPNIQLFHNEDLKHDLPGAITRLGQILGQDLSAPFVEAVAHAATFSSMKANAANFAPSADRGIWKDNAQFFASGSSRKWDGALSAEVMDHYGKRMDTLLGSGDSAWFETGAQQGT